VIGKAKPLTTKGHQGILVGIAVIAVIADIARDRENQKLTADEH